MSVTCDHVIGALESLRLTPSPQENALHEAVAHALIKSGIPFIHEARLAPGCRIDFLCEHVGIEIKRGRPSRRVLLDQLTRYCSCDQLSALILVVERTASLPRTCQGKELRVLSLNRLWGVSLP